MKIYRCFFALTLITSLLYFSSVLGKTPLKVGGPPDQGSTVGQKVIKAFLAQFDEYTLSVSHENPDARRDFLSESLRLSTAYSFKAQKAIKENTDEGKTYLRFRLKVFEYDGPELAHAAFRALFDSARPDSGLTYSWDYVLLNQSELYWLNAGCLYSKARWEKKVEAVDQAVLGEQPPGSEPMAFKCDCGFGCRKK